MGILKCHSRDLRGVDDALALKLHRRIDIAVALKDIVLRGLSICILDLRGECDVLRRRLAACCVTHDVWIAVSARIGDRRPVVQELVAVVARVGEIAVRQREGILVRAFAVARLQRRTAVIGLLEDLAVRSRDEQRARRDMPLAVDGRRAAVYDVLPVERVVFRILAGDGHGIGDLVGVLDGLRIVILYRDLAVRDGSIDEMRAALLHGKGNLIPCDETRAAAVRLVDRFAVRRRVGGCRVVFLGVVLHRVRRAAIIPREAVRREVPLRDGAVEVRRAAGCLADIPERAARGRILPGRVLLAPDDVPARVDEVVVPRIRAGKLDARELYIMRSRAAVRRERAVCFLRPVCSLGIVIPEAERHIVRLAVFIRLEPGHRLVL